MRLVIQRVSSAKLEIENELFSQINQGLLVYVCITPADTQKELEFYANKVAGLRIFEDENGKMNLDVKNINGEIMIVSNFSLTADISHGFRPSFSGCAEKGMAKEYYEKFVEMVKQNCRVKVVTGVFGADMKIKSENNGPINIIV